LKCKFEVVAAHALHVILYAHCVCDVIIAFISRGTFPTLAAII